MISSDLVLYRVPYEWIQILNLICLGGADVEVVQTYKYLGVHLNDKLDWSTNTEALYKKSQSSLFISAEVDVIKCIH